VFFRIPQLGQASDFYTLPHPNDIRRYGLTTNFEGFPGVGESPIPGDLLNQYIAGNRQPSLGFGLNETVYFRFDGLVDYETLQFGGDDSNFSFVDITPESSRYGLPPRSRFYATGGGDEYICPNWLGIRPSEGTPLATGKTYAVYFRKTLLDTNGVPFEAGDDLKLLLENTPPTHPALQHAWVAYAPFRDFLQDKGIPTEDVVGATVFTTGDPRERMAGVRVTVHEAPQPTLDSVTPCRQGVASPCGGGGERGCADDQGDFAEVHARLSIPNVLTGAAPYDSWGGQAIFRGRRPVIQRQESICVSFSLPQSAAPPRGWPTVVFAHGFGGNFRSAISSGLAEKLTKKGWLVIGYDGVLHGGRFGLTDNPSPEELAERLYDINRPGLLRDQAVQGMTDLHAITRFTRSGRLEVGGTEIRFDPDNLVVVGHGLGAEYAVPYLAYEPDVRATILSGAGGSMTDILRLMTQPRRVGVELSLGLGSDKIRAMHPAMQQIQTWLDPRDPQNYGALLRNPPDGISRKHVLYLQGVGDNALPTETISALLVSMSLKLVGEVLLEMKPVKSAEENELPLRMNVAGQVTQGVKQYAATAAGAHRVMFEHPKAIADIESFLQDLVSEGVPTIRP